MNDVSAPITAPTTAPAAAPAVARVVRAGLARFSTAEFLRMIEKDAFGDIKVELVVGELQRMPPPGNRHSLSQIMMVAELLRLLPPSLVRAEAGIDLGADSIVACDAAVLRAAVEGDGPIPADEVLLVAEVAVSTLDRDLGLKRRLYAAAGIPTYWVVDAERAVIHVFDRPEGDEYKGLALVRFGEPLAVPGAAVTPAGTAARTAAGTEATIVLGGSGEPARA